MLLKKIAEAIGPDMEPAVRAAVDVEVTGIAYDSRNVVSGDLFVAMQGGSFDAHEYIEAAHNAGAVAFIVEKAVPYLTENGLPHVVVKDGRKAMGEAAAAFYDYPSRKIKLVGVTGTSGKTTVTHLIKAVFEANGIKAGLIGTLGAKAGDVTIPTQHTTPESADIQSTLAQMVSEQVQVVAMETSSHGLYQGRTHGCEFDCAVMTNIARDHLDFHKTLEAYLDAKLILFRDYPLHSSKEFTGVVNADDHSYQQVRSAVHGDILSFGIDNPADFWAENICVESQSLSYKLCRRAESVDIRLGIGGMFNVYNSMASAAVASTFGLNLEEISHGLEAACCVPGRFEAVDCGQDFSVIVDYAHTPDELENVLNTASSLPHSKLIAVFGCGGDRDRGKRPLMGNIASDIADIAIITSDNPRSEDPDAIIKEILEGVESGNRSRVRVNADRKSAISEAVKMAHAGDIIVIAGKGHEDYQILADRTIHFDDREVVREILRELVK